MLVSTWERVFVLLVGLAGCSGESVEPEDQLGGTGGVPSGVGGTGGAGLGGDGTGLGGDSAGAGAGGGAPEPAARGASRVSPYSSGCGAGPYVIPALGTATNERVTGDRIEDGVDGDVDCTVSLASGQYRVRISLEEEASSFSLVATLSPQDDGSYTGTGSVGFYHPNAGNIFSETCTVEVLSTQEIGVGKVWGNFECTQSSKEASPGYSCNFEGSFIAENCSG